MQGLENICNKKFPCYHHHDYDYKNNFERYNTLLREHIQETGNQWNITRFYGAMEFSFEKYRETFS